MVGRSAQNEDVPHPHAPVQPGRELSELRLGDIPETTFAFNGGSVSSSGQEEMPSES